MFFLSVRVWGEAENTAALGTPQLGNKLEPGGACQPECLSNQAGLYPQAQPLVFTVYLKTLVRESGARAVGLHSAQGLGRPGSSQVPPL